MLAMDLDNGYGWFHKNGTYQNSGDPTGGSSKTAFNLASDYADRTSFCSVYQSIQQYKQTLATHHYSISSGNSDGNGYGNFEYTVPSGYALNTSNLNTYG